MLLPTPQPVEAIPQPAEVTGPQAECLVADIAVQILLTALRCKMDLGELLVEICPGGEFIVTYDEESGNVVFVPCPETMQ